MNSIANYGSDDDYDDSPEEKQMDSHTSSRPYRKPGTAKQDDANYDEVQMSLSEDSSDESRPARDHSRRHSRDRDDHHRSDSRRHSDHDASRGSPKSRDDRYRKDKNDRREERHVTKNDREEDRSRYREDNREEDRTRDRYRGEKEEERPKERRAKSRERYTRDDRYRDRKDRERRRSRSPRDRDRRRSRSPKASRSPRRTERSRSKSKERSSRGGYSKRYERANNKMERLDKMGIEIKTPDCQYVTPSDLQKSMGEEKKENKDRFFVPGITGRFREQIEKRKLLWQKKETEAKPEAVPSAQSIAGPGGSRTTKVWEATTFAQDTDGKVANKFKRLMGIKNAAEGSNTAVDVLKKQEEMFSSMEQQYEVARTATHTMRDLEILPANLPRQFSISSRTAKESLIFEK